jgi:hypothetical protein
LHWLGFAEPGFITVKTRMCSALKLVGVMLCNCDRVRPQRRPYIEGEFSVESQVYARDEIEVDQVLEMVRKSTDHLQS